MVYIYTKSRCRQMTASAHIFTNYYAHIFTETYAVGER